MNTQTLTLVLIAVVILVVIGLVSMLATRSMRSKKLREKFGPEYDYTLEKVGDKRAAEETLAEREKRVGKLDIRDLDEKERNRYLNEWIEIQKGFVDDPSKSVEAANRLVTEVMTARGFPVTDFEQRAADLSVLYPEFVSNYRCADDIAAKNQRNEASTEDLRQAMVYYRSLYKELLGGVDVHTAEGEVKEIVTQ